MNLILIKEVTGSAEFLPPEFPRKYRKEYPPLNDQILFHSRNTDWENLIWYREETKYLLNEGIMNKREIGIFVQISVKL